MPATKKVPAKKVATPKEKSEEELLKEKKAEARKLLETEAERVNTLIEDSVRQAKAKLDACIADIAKQHHCFVSVFIPRDKVQDYVAMMINNPNSSGITFTPEVIADINYFNSL